MLHLTEQEILEKYFPMPTPRDGQLKVIKDIHDAFLNGKRFVIAEMPTGWGKSVIAKTLADITTSGKLSGNPGKACYVTSQILLQQQLTADFGEDGKFKKGAPLVELTGRGNYKCVYADIVEDITDEKRNEIRKKCLNCATGFCKLKGESMCDACVTDEEFPLAGNLCPYWQQVDKFLGAKIGLMNFKSFLFQLSFNGYFRQYATDLLIIDEAHNAEGELLDFVEISFNSEMFYKLLRMVLPECNTPEEYADWFKKDDVVTKLRAEALVAKAQERIRDSEDMARLAVKIKKFMEGEFDNWVVKKEGSGKKLKIQLKPIFVDDFANSLLFSRTDKVLMMSATILDANVLCESLGIKKEDMIFIRMDNNFPVKNRPILFMPMGSMSYKNKAKTLPNMVDGINEICEIHENEKGIIHTHNFANAEYVLSNSSRATRDRLLFQKYFSSRAEMLEEHAKSQNSVLIAPALHEGVDLKDDLSRFQVIMKMPYANFVDDPQLKVRMELSQGYYDWLTLLKLVQSYGRSVRSETDHAITYILDSDFNMLLGKAKAMFPPWVLDAVERAS